MRLQVVALGVALGTFLTGLTAEHAVAASARPWVDHVGKLSPADASARPWRGYVRNDDIRPVKPAPVEGGGPWVLYLNGRGGVIEGTSNGTWEENSSENKSTIADPGDHTVPSYQYGDASWAEVVQCMREQYARFGITITDEDPGATPHVEVVFAPMYSTVAPSEREYDDYVGGVAPFGCSPINGAMTYVFTNLWGNSPRDICETAAQESAHAFGLDHEDLCEDPMTYKSGCGNKSFQDVDAACGELNGPRACQCGGSTQNSVQMLYSILGARGDGGPPSVEISNPTDGATVQQGFVIDVQATDEISVARVELFLDGETYAVDSTPPYGFRSPSNLAEGGHEIRAIASNFAGQTDEHTINIEVAPPCTNEDNNCAEHYVCLGGACVPGPDFEGGLGAPCGDGITCAVGECGSDGSDQLCVGGCALDGSTTCPRGFDCLDGGGAGVCWPNGEDIDDGGASGGCAAAVSRHGATGGGLFALGLLGGLLGLGLRRRRRARR